MVFKPPQPPASGGNPVARVFAATKFRKQELQHHIRCPECGVAMVERDSAKGQFYGCSRFPLCIGIRPIGEGVDSYTRLLRDAYAKAVVFLASPVNLGAQEAARWLLSRALNLEHIDLRHYPIIALANATLERAIDIAIEYAREKDKDLDFLVLAHEERMSRMRSSLRGNLDPQMIKRLPKPEIVRRYDDSDMLTMEAQLTQEWKRDGRYCPRCGAWSEGLPHRLSSDGFVTQKDWDCANCGEYSQSQLSASAPFIFVRDKEDSDNVEGTDFGPTGKRYP